MCLLDKDVSKLLALYPGIPTAEVSIIQVLLAIRNSKQTAK